MSHRTKWDNYKRELRARKPEMRPKKPPIWLGYRMPSPFKPGMYEKPIKPTSDTMQAET